MQSHWRIDRDREQLSVLVPMTCYRLSGIQSREYSLIVNLRNLGDGPVALSLRFGQIKAF